MVLSAVSFPYLSRLLEINPIQCEHGEVEVKKRNLHSITPQVYLSCKSIRDLSCSCNEHVINKKEKEITSAK